MSEVNRGAEREVSGGAEPLWAHSIFPSLYYNIQYFTLFEMYREKYIASIKGKFHNMYV